MMTHKFLGLALAAIFFLSAVTVAIARNSAGPPASSGQTLSQSNPTSTTSVQSQGATGQPYPAQSDQGQQVATMKNPEQKLVSAPVRDMLGRSIGTVESIQTSADGKPTALQILVSAQDEPDKRVTIPASAVTYDPRTRVVIAQMTRTEIDAMPPGTTVPAPMIKTPGPAPTDSSAVAPREY